jgi:hypothetical protein
MDKYPKNYHGTQSVEKLSSWENVRKYVKMDDR